MSWKMHFCAGKPVYGATCSTLCLGTAGLVSGSHFAVMTHTSLAKEVTTLWKTPQQCFSWEEADEELLLVLLLTHKADECESGRQRS